MAVVRISRHFCWQLSCCTRLVLEHLASDLGRQLAFHPLQQHAARLVSRKPRDLLQQFELPREVLFELVLLYLQAVSLLGESQQAGGYLGFPLGQQFEFLVEQVGSLLDPALLLAQATPRRFHLGVELLAALQALFLGAHLGLPAYGLCLALGVGDDLLGQRRAV